MSHFNAATATPESSSPDSTSAETMQYGPIYSAYPRMSVGFALIALCWVLLLEACQAEGPMKNALETAGLLAAFAGYLYWLFCVHRIHKILAEYTHDQYPIAPWKAVAFHFIPLYSIYWLFKWPGALAKFVNDRPFANQDAGPMRGRAPAIVLLVASIFTSLFGFEIGIGFQLLLLFVVGVYLISKMQQVLPAPEAVCVRRSKQLKVSAAAGVGAAFSSLLFGAIYEFFSRTPKLEREHELLAILLVSIGVIIFLEPMSERLRQLVAHDHPVLKVKKSWSLRWAVFGVLAGTSLLDGMAHTALDNWMKDSDGYKKIIPLAAAVLVSGGITYFWIGAGHLHRPHAIWSGAFGGAALAIVVGISMTSVFWAGPNDFGHQREEVNHRLVEHIAVPGVPPMVTQQLAEGDHLHVKAMLILAIPWLLMGLAGGAVIDRRWSHCCAGNLAVSIVSAGIIGGLLLKFMGSNWADTTAHLPAVAGWVLALLLCCSPKTLGIEPAPDHAKQQSAILADAIPAS